MLLVSCVVCWVLGPSDWPERGSEVGGSLVAQRAFLLSYCRGRLGDIRPPVGEGLVLVEACGCPLIRAVVEIVRLGGVRSAG